ncbi:MAG: LptF/LptG family permease [Bacteroidales bacterium]|nr:LptF/LptG family permease [Bacteroidales bacterium]
MFSYPLIDRYILGKYLKTFLLWFVLITVIVITFDISEKLDDFIKERAPLSEIIFQYYVNFIPNFFNLYGQLFIFISTLFFTSKMAANTEIIAILGSGISYQRFLRPYLHGATLLCIFMLLIGNFVIPRSNIQLEDFEGKYIHTSKRSYYSNLHFQTSAGVQVFTFSYDVAEKSATLFQQDSYDSSGILVERLCANKLTFDTLSGQWNALGLVRRTFDGDNETCTNENHATLSLHLEPNDFNEAAKQITTMNSIELYDHIQHEIMRGSGAVTEAKIEFYQRILNPLAFIIMTLIGVAISSRKTRGGIGVHLAIGITLAFAFIVMMRMFAVFAINGNYPPFLAVLTPQLTFAIAALILIKKAPK